MKLRQNAPQEIYRTNLNKEERKGFDVKVGKKTFKILSKSLYKHKKRAIIREVSTNAIDGHIAAGNMNPFDVYLPTQLDPRFVVRDYGTGLSDDDVMHMYKTYFESTKEDSNDYIGALGLGSKSPFCDADTFTIESIFNGVKRGYVAYMEDDEPFIDPTYVMDTDEPTGVIITVPVRQDEINEWITEARRVYQPFGKIRPNIVNMDLTINYMPREVDDYGMIRFESNYYSGVYALMGDILYPIDDTFYKKTMFECYRRDKYVYVLPFELGDLDFMPSREELSLDKATKKVISDRFEEIHKLRYRYFEGKFNQNKTIRDKVNFYSGLNHLLTIFVDTTEEFHVDGKPMQFYHSLLYKDLCNDKGTSIYYKGRELAGYWANRIAYGKTKFISTGRNGIRKHESSRYQNVTRIYLPTQQKKLLLIHVDETPRLLSRALVGYCLLNNTHLQTNFIEYYGDINEPKIQAVIKGGLFDESEVVELKISQMKAEIEASAKVKEITEPKEREKRPASPNVFRYTKGENGNLIEEDLRMLKKEFVELSGPAFMIYGTGDFLDLDGNSTRYAKPKDVKVFDYLNTSEFYVIRASMVRWVPQSGLYDADKKLQDVFVDLMKTVKPNQYGVPLTSGGGEMRVIREWMDIGLEPLVKNKPTEAYEKLSYLARAMYSGGDNKKYLKTHNDFYTNQDAMNERYRQAMVKFKELNPTLFALIDFAWDYRHSSIADKVKKADIIENFKKLIKWK